MRKVVLFLIILLLWFSPAVAHRVNLFAYAEMGEIYTESYFSDGQPAQGKVEVFDSENNLLIKGNNSHEGMFHFIAPTPAKTLRIVLSAPMGHRCSFTLTKDVQIAGQKQ